MTQQPNPVYISEENHDLKRHIHPSVLCSTIYNSQDMAATQVPIQRGRIKESGACIHIHNGILLSHKKNEIMTSVATWIHLEIIIKSEVSRSEKDEYHMILPICGI